MKSVMGMPLLLVACLQLAACGQAASVNNIGSFKVTSSGHDDGGDFCTDFRLSDEQAGLFFARAHAKTASELHEGPDYLPCWVRGTAADEASRSQWEIRAGGTATLTLADGTVHLFACTDCDDLLGGEADK